MNRGDTMNRGSMNRRSFLKLAELAGLAVGLPATALTAKPHGTKPTPAANAAPSLPSPETILLKDYRPQSIYKIPVTNVPRAKFPIIDMHSHPYAKTDNEIEQWVRNMDEVGVEKTVILARATGAEFDQVSRKYLKHPGRFEMW